MGKEEGKGNIYLGYQSTDHLGQLTTKKTVKWPPVKSQLTTWWRNWWSVDQKSTDHQWKHRKWGY